MTHICRITLHNGVKALISLQFDEIFSVLSQAFLENDLGLIVECILLDFIESFSSTGLFELIISLLTLSTENLQALFFATIKVKVDLH